MTMSLLSGRNILDYKAATPNAGTLIAISLKSEPNYITLRCLDLTTSRWGWPFNEPMESLLPNFGPVADGAKPSDVLRNGCDVV